MRFTMADSRLKPWCSGGAGVNFFDIPNMSAMFFSDIYSFSNYLSTAEKYFLWNIFCDCFIIFPKHLCGFKNNSMLKNYHVSNKMSTTVANFNETYFCFNWPSCVGQAERKPVL